MAIPNGLPIREWLLILPILLCAEIGIECNLVDYRRISAHRHV